MSNVIKCDNEDCTKTDETEYLFSVWKQSMKYKDLCHPCLINFIRENPRNLCFKVKSYGQT